MGKPQMLSKLFWGSSKPLQHVCEDTWHDLSRRRACTRACILVGPLCHSPGAMVCRAVLKGVTSYCLMLTWPSLVIGRRLAVAALAASVAPVVACTRILVDNKVLQPATGLHQVCPLADAYNSPLGSISPCLQC